MQKLPLEVLPTLRRSLSFSGCAGREEFIAVLLVTAAVDLVLWLAIGAGHVPVPHFPGRYVILFGGKGAFAALLTAAIHSPLIATAARRWHDGDITGWFLLFYVVTLPLVGASAIYTAIGMTIGLPPTSKNRYDPDRRAPVLSNAAT